MKEIRFGVIGTNFVTDMFMKGISLVAGCRVNAVCATTEDSIAKFAQLAKKLRITNYFNETLSFTSAGN